MKRSFTESFNIFAANMIKLLSMVRVFLEGTLMANHALVCRTIILCDDFRVFLTENPKHLYFLLQHLVHSLSELFGND